MVDADCLVAGVLTPAGATSTILAHWRRGALELVVCPGLLEEVRKTLALPRITAKYGLDEDDISAFVTALSADGVLFEDPVDPPRTVPHDPNDDYLVALAREAGAILVTRDRHFEPVAIEGLRIITPGRFVREFRA